jgi:hypothetical protein
MDRYQFARFADSLKRLGAAGIRTQEFVLGRDKNLELQYIPFEHVNLEARLVIVGITPGNTQISSAYQKAQDLLKAGRPESEILVEVIKTGAFAGGTRTNRGGMRANLVKMLHHFQFDRLLGISDAATLWAENAHLLHSTSVVPHAAFKSGKMFAGGFDKVKKSKLLFECFMDCFVPSAQEMPTETLFVGLGKCPQAALEWCIESGILQRRQVLGAFCHPSGQGGSAVSYYLRKVTRGELKLKNPVLKYADWLDDAYEEMKRTTTSLLDNHWPVDGRPLPEAPQQWKNRNRLRLESRSECR